MKTKILIPLFTLMCLLATSATAQVNYAVSGNAAYVTNSPNASGNIIIASTYNGYPVTSIGNQAFYDCSSLQSVTIPSSVTSIGDLAFWICISLTNVTIGNSVTNIGNGAFNYCSSLASVTIPDSVISIGGGTFSGCTSLTSVTIPNSVVTLGAVAFYECHSLASVTIGNRVTSIADQAFYHCYSLANVTIPNSVSSIGKLAFYSCTSLVSVTIPNGVTSVGQFAFESCTSLTSVTIPNSVTSIGDNAFFSCNGVTNFSVDVVNSVYSSLDGVLFNKAQTTLIQFPGARGGSYAVPNSVTTIGDQALESGYPAFSHCANLTSVMIGNGVTSIGFEAFSYCGNLTNLTFLGNAPSGGYGMFEGIAAGAKVYYYYGTTGWGAFYGVLPTVMLGAPAPQVGTGSVGVKPGGFGFTLNGVTNQTIVVEASTNLANWQSIWTSTLSTPSTNFVDPDWVNHPHRFYRLRSP